MNEKVKDAFKSCMKRHTDVMEADNSNTDERAEAAYAADGIVKLYAEIAGIDYDEAAAELHNA